MKRCIKDVYLHKVLTFSFTTMTVSLVGIQHSSAVMLIPDEIENQNISSWLTGLPLDDANFGATVALFNRDLALGAPSQVFLDPDSDEFPYGAVFSLDEGKIEWDDGDILTDNDAVDDNCIYLGNGWELGDSVAITATHLAVGAPKKNRYLVDTCYSKVGSVYLYQKLANPFIPSWVEIANMNPTAIAAGNLFGDSVALTSQQLMVGASGILDGTDLPGNVYIYDLWNLSETPIVINSGINEKNAFGAAIAIDKSSQTLMAVGSPFANQPGTDACGSGGYQEGAVYVYRIDNGSWTPGGVLWPPDSGVWGGFGSAVACGTDIAGVERIVVGEPVRCLSGGPCAFCYESFFAEHMCSDMIPLVRSGILRLHLNHQLLSQKMMTLVILSI